MTALSTTVKQHKATIAASAIAIVSVFSQTFPKSSHGILKFFGIVSDHIENACDLHEDLLDKYGDDLDSAIAQLPPRMQKLVKNFQHIADAAKSEKLSALDKMNVVMDKVAYTTKGLTEEDLSMLPPKLTRAILSVDERVTDLKKAAEGADHLKEALSIARNKELDLLSKVSGVLDAIDESDDHLTADDLASLPINVQQILQRATQKMDTIKETVGNFQAIQESYAEIQAAGDTISDEITA